MIYYMREVVLFTELSSFAQGAQGTWSNLGQVHGPLTTGLGNARQGAETGTLLDIFTKSTFSSV